MKGAVNRICPLNLPMVPILTWGGGNYHIRRYEMCHFWRAFFRAENKFWGIIFGKITSSHKFGGVILEIKLFRVLILIKFHGCYTDDVIPCIR